MIEVRVYKNGYEVTGHASPSICSQISLWHWATSNILLGLDSNAKEYASGRDNLDNPSEGYSWATFNPEINNLQWLFDDLITSLSEWINDWCKGEAKVEHADGILSNG